MDLTDPWDPMSLEEIVELFAGAPFRWWISGGVALELFVGRSWREHEDADVGVLRRDAAAVYRWLDGWELAVGAAGRLAPWGGRGLAVGQNNVWVRRPGGSIWLIDLAIGSGDDEKWIYRRDPDVVRPWESAVLRSAGGVPYLAPELQLLFKSKAPRPKDTEDAAIVMPLLSPRERSFLGSLLPIDHPWHRLLDSI